MKDLINYLAAALNRVFTAKTTPEFYYRHEQLQYEHTLENNRVSYMNSFDKAA